MNKCIIQPITSEPIFVITKDTTNKVLIPAGTTIPCDTVVIDDLMPTKDHQEAIELPICVGNENKMLFNLKITRDGGFLTTAQVTLALEITADKLLLAKAHCMGVSCMVEPQNPFANKELSTEERIVLRAEREANIETERNGGIPTKKCLISLRKAYEDAGNDFKAAETLEQQISDLNSAIDSIQSAYDTLNSAVEEYNSNGGTLSIDTIQSLLSLSDEYLACLQVENGQLSLNADAMNALAQSKLDEAQAIAVTQAMTELETIAKGENAQSTTNYISGNAALMSSLAQLSGSYEGVAQAAMTAAQAQKLSAFISNASAKDKTATENVMKGLDTKLKLIQSTQNKIKSSGLGFSKKSSKNSSPTQSTTNKEKEYLDSYMTYMNKMLEGGKISYQQYVQQVSDKLEHMFKAGKISAKEYFDYTEKRLEQQKSVFDSALKAITGKLDDAIEEWQDKIKSLEKENDSYNDELDKYSSILSAIDKVYDNEINRIQDIID